MIKKDAKIFLTGHRGLVGGAIYRRLQKEGFTNIITRSHSELDLCNQQAVEEFFEKEKPEYVILAAAKVGGIMANSQYPAEFIYQNLLFILQCTFHCLSHHARSKSKGFHRNICDNDNHKNFYDPRENFFKKW